MNREEKLWRKAIRIVNEDYPEVPQGSSQWWSLVFGVFKRMMGRKPITTLTREKILKKELNISTPVLALLNLLEPMLGPPEPVTFQQLMLDLPPPPTLANLMALAPHYSSLFPHLTQPVTEEALRYFYLSQPVFVPLTPEEIIFYLRQHPIAFGETAEESLNQEWAREFNSVWYLSLLVGMVAGIIPPRGREGWRWLLQIASNPFYRQSLQERFNEAWKGVKSKLHVLQGKTWEDCISLRHRQATFHWKRPLTGIVLSPSKLQQVWCVDKELLSQPLVPASLEIRDLPNWLIAALTKIRPLMSIIAQPREENITWVPYVGGSLDDPERDCIAIVVFSSRGIKASVPIVEVDFDTPYEDIIQIVRTVYTKQRGAKA